MQFQSLPGFREFYPDSCSRRNHIFSQWKKTARAFNFQEYDAPVLEPLELYTEKSGEEIVDQLFSFEDRGGRAVALRAEMTPSLARLIGTKANSLKRPIKWYHVGEHYRYEKPQKGRLRAFYQFNADIFGEAGSGADAELITLLVQALSSFGLTENDFKVRLSDRDLWLIILAAAGIPEDSFAEVLGAIDKLERTDRAKTIERLSAVLGDQAEAFLIKVEALIAIRDFDILADFVSNLALDEKLAVRAQDRLENWKSLLSFLNNSGVGDFIRIDLGIVRGLAYYTGFVFEAFEATGQGRALAGGGRYDNLVRKLGGPEIAAVGFAMGDVTLVDLLESKKLLPDYIDRPDFIAIIGGSGARKAALKDVSLLRSFGYCIDFPLKDQGFGKQFKDANLKGARFALIYGSDEVEKNVVKIRDFTSGAEQEFSRETLPEIVAELVGGSFALGKN
jgi:histidyl-tRNA synthetase